ncbi:MAG: hypothetical protein CL536_08245 [Alcaligenaceae bacterium]|nr:hypothetical protein [Alcaligenaceae bacterium]HCD05062.1 hypothetical protein [Methylophaga sp.]
MASGSIRQPLRILLLPTRPGNEATCAKALKRALTDLNVTSADFGHWIDLQLQTWRNSGTANKELQRTVQSVINAALADGSPAVVDQGNRLAKNYFGLHSKLMYEHLMSHEEATALLSHAFLIAHLADYERLTAAQIANVLSQRDGRATFSRQNVLTVLKTMGINVDFTKAQLIALYHRDARQELAVLSDSDFITSAELVAEAGIKLGAQSDLLGALKTLAPKIKQDSLDSRYTPYLQMLHYQCVIAEFVDHAVTDIYEFNPRGEKFTWLQKKYPHTIAGAKNAFLNNAKSVETLDIGWVRSKKRGRPGAMALLNILESMEAMGFSARRELAWWFRLWLHRVIRIAETTPLPLPAVITRNQIENLITAIGRGNTKTFGILEQRLLDAVAATIHKGWRPKGLRDPVNATNISTAKLGDCDFIDVATTSLIAYESHGGKLSAVYVDQHLATIEKTLSRRIDELTAVADIGDWKVSIKFIAHTVDPDIPQQIEIGGLALNIITDTFANFFANNIQFDDEYFYHAVQEYLLTPLRAQRTPNEVRMKLMQLIGNE